VKETWSRWTAIDAGGACQFMEGQYKRIDSDKYKVNSPSPFACLVIRERTFFEAPCKEQRKQYSESLIAFARNLNIHNVRRNQAYLDSIVSSGKCYPGRSAVGATYEGWAWQIIDAGSSSYVDGKLGYLQHAVEAGELHPMWLAITLDKIQIRASGKQIYGTQRLQGNNSGLLCPLQDPDLIKELRHSMGLNLLDSNAPGLINLMKYYGVYL
jgi:hypothetical protein